jgi:pimeloyl-ACP methyl ester carboxylesterase
MSRSQPRLRHKRRAIADSAKQLDLGALPVPKMPTLIAAGAALAAAGAAVLNHRRGRAAERAHPPIGRFIDIDGIAVHYVDQGEGQPIVLLHGNGALVEDWFISGIIDRLTRRFRVIAIDRPGSGYTDRPRDRLWTPSAQAALMRRVAARLGLERPVVVGHSWGAMVAMAWALDHQNELGGIVLMSGYYFPTPRRDVLIFGAPGLPVIGDVLRYTISPPISRLIAPKLIETIFAPAPVPEQFTQTFPLELALRPWALRASAEDTGFMIPSAAAQQSRYKDLRLPVTILSGSADKVVTASRQSQRLQREIAHSELRILPGLGHMIHYFAQDEIVARIEAMAERAAARPPAQPSYRGHEDADFDESRAAGAASDLRMASRGGLR